MKGFNILKRIFETFQGFTEGQIKKIELANINLESTLASSNMGDAQDRPDQEMVFSYSKFLISRFIINCLKTAMENYKDPKQQFNSLLILDSLFSQTLGGPSLEEELEFYRENW
jgi:hypothetical protein